MSARRVTEAPGLGAAVERMLRALVRRAAAGDTEALEQLCQLDVELAASTRKALRGLHEFGYSYAELASVTGTSRQAVAQRMR